MTVILSQEAQAWLRATAVGVELPAAVGEVHERLEKVEAEREALGGPLEVPTPSKLVAAGVPLDKAQAEHEKKKAEAAGKEELRRVAEEGRHGVRFMLNRRVIEHRDALVMQLRPLIDDVVRRSRPLAETLAPFAPGYTPGDVVRRGDAKALKAWQDAEVLEQEFGVLIAAWRASLKAATALGQPGWIDVREVPDAALYWTRPEVVTNPALNGEKLNRSGHPVKIAPTILGVAAEPEEAGFRLATVEELRAIFEAAHPQIAPVRRYGARAI
jgi:hypothetical protein